MRNKTKSLAFLVLLLGILQLILFAVKKIIFVFIERTDFSDRMASMSVMIILTFILIHVTRHRKIPLSFLPERFGLFYIIITAVTAVIYILTPSNFSGGYEDILLLLYSSVVVPFYEELIFRGYVWNKLRASFSGEWTVYAITAILFALWHIGYVDSLAFRTQTGLFNVMVWKVITGLCYGIILGAVRMKTKNCYSTALLHGVMNVFAR